MVFLVCFTAYTIFIELPFSENALVNENRDSAQITRIIVDGTATVSTAAVAAAAAAPTTTPTTMKRIIFVYVQLLSVDRISHAFTISIGKCPIAETAKPASAAAHGLNGTFSHTRKILLPHKTETFIFSLPLKDFDEHAEYTCEGNSIHLLCVCMCVI